MKKHQSQQAESLREQWEYGVERAIQAVVHEEDLETNALQRAAGIRVRTALNAGQSSYGNCTYPIAICPLMEDGILSYGSYGY